MKTLSEHYKELLGLDEFWSVDDVTINLPKKRVDIEVVYIGEEVQCPQCKTPCAKADHMPERTWRHLDTMQFETIIKSCIPRSACAQCGIKTIDVPWSDKYSRFTLLFEAFVLKVLEASSTIQSASHITGLGWNQLHSIMRKAVERGLSKRCTDEIEYVGIDEKSFRSGHRYISTLNDLDKGCVLEVVEGRDEDSADKLWDVFTEKQRGTIKAVAMDMWKAYINTAEKNVPEADIVHDRFHISGYLNKAVDTVRKVEHRSLQGIGNDILKGTKYDWLRNPENMHEEQWYSFSSLKDIELKTSKAWAIKEQFRWFWEYTYTANAKKFFKQWYNWAIRSKLEPIKEAAKTIKEHIENILTYFKHWITNAVSEGLNSRIQSIKSAARGFHSFENYRTRILFYCGKLDLSNNSTN